MAAVSASAPAARVVAVAAYVCVAASVSGALAEPRSEASPGRAGGFGAVGRTSGSCFLGSVRVCPFPPFRLLT